MPWFKIDDTAHAHPKLLKAGNAALGLWVRAGAYAAQHLTEGVIPAVVTQLYGTASQTRKLVAAGLWHEHGHHCARCPQPPAGDYVMHDYLTYNPTRAKVEDQRAQASARQQRAREKTAEQRNQERNPSDSSANRARIDDSSSTENRERHAHRTVFPGDIAGQTSTSHRDGTEPSRPPRPDPSPVLPSEVHPPTPRGEQGPAVEMFAAWWTRYGSGTAQGKAGIRRAIDGALGNGIAPRELWAALDRLGALSKPVTGGTLQFALAELKKSPPGADVIPLATARPSTTDQRVAAGMDLAARLRAQEGNTV